MVARTQQIQSIQDSFRKRLKPFSDCLVSPLPPALNVDLRGESARAARAFRIFSDLGPHRSLNAAWKKHLEDRGQQGQGERCPGRWKTWAKRWNWFERAACYDYEQSALRRAYYNRLEDELVEFECKSEIGSEAFFRRN